MYADTAFNSYKGGIIECPTYTTTNHAMLYVGYGTENGVDYMIFRNSWGDWWGNNGYGKIKFGNCNSYPQTLYRPVFPPDEWTCGVNEKDVCNCECGAYDPDCKDTKYVNGKVTLNPSNCENGTICSKYTGKCTNWTCDPLYYNSRGYCDCSCGSWDPDCEDNDGKSFMRGCNRYKGEICSRIDGSCVANWTCGMKNYAVPGKCHCGCGVYDPGCENCDSELINCTERPVCKSVGSGSSVSSSSQLLFSSVLLLFSSILF